MEPKAARSLVESEATQQLFCSLSYQYKYNLIESIVHLRQEILREIEQLERQTPFKADLGGADSCSDSFDSPDRK